jgi:glycosyltransferase involved in cell wall biosynthesis
MEFEKGVQYLLDALQDVRYLTRVFIIGEGAYLQQLRSKARQLGGKHEIIFTGWVDNEELDKFYAGADVAVVPSIWPEPFGIVGIEAMAHGLPVLAFDVGGISDWLQHDHTGYLLPPRRADALAEKLNYLFDNRMIARKLGKAARSCVDRKFIYSVHLQKLMKIFKRAAGNSLTPTERGYPISNLKSKINGAVPKFTATPE